MEKLLAPKEKSLLNLLGSEGSAPKPGIGLPLAARQRTLAESHKQSAAGRIVGGACNTAGIVCSLSCSGLNALNHARGYQGCRTQEPLVRWVLCCA
jgi:hypothetical protein